jgi:predicted permease
MEDIIVVGWSFIVSLVWLCFLSWVISRFAFKEEPPARRAALTAAAALGTAVAIGLAMIFLAPDPLPLLPRIATSEALLALLYYLPAALIDFVLLRASFRKAWVDDAEPFR